MSGTDKHGWAKMTGAGVPKTGLYEVFDSSDDDQRLKIMCPGLGSHWTHYKEPTPAPPPEPPADPERVRCEVEKDGCEVCYNHNDASCFVTKAPEDTRFLGFEFKGCGDRPEDLCPVPWAWVCNDGARTWWSLQGRVSFDEKWQHAVAVWFKGRA